jgi:hypothetical protein
MHKEAPVLGTGSVWALLKCFLGFADRVWPDILERIVDRSPRAPRPDWRLGRLKDKVV